MNKYRKKNAYCIIYGKKEVSAIQYLTVCVVLLSLGLNRWVGGLK